MLEREKKARISYGPLFKEMKIKNISRYKIEKLGINTSTYSNIKHNKLISLSTILRLCEILRCNVDHIITVYFE